MKRLKNMNPKKRDRVFVLVLAVVVANLAYQLIRGIITATSGQGNLLWWGFMILVDIIAIVGAFWLLQEYRKSRRQNKQQ